MQTKEKHKKHPPFLKATAILLFPNPSILSSTNASVTSSSPSIKTTLRKHSSNPLKTLQNPKFSPNKAFVKTIWKPYPNFIRDFRTRFLFVKFCSVYFCKVKSLVNKRKQQKKLHPHMHQNLRPQASQFYRNFLSFLLLLPTAAEQPTKLSRSGNKQFAQILHEAARSRSPATSSESVSATQTQRKQSRKTKEENKQNQKAKQ